MIVGVFEGDILDLELGIWYIPDILNPCLESKDNGPDESKRESWVSVDDVVWSEVLKMNVLISKELQRLLHVLQAVDAHLASRRFRLKL